MKKTYLQKGFTLIELLVVIAIIGILSSVVLASLNTARGKGSDAAVKSNLANIRSQAEIIYDTDGDYDAVCGANGATQNSTVALQLNAASQAGAGNTTSDICGMPASGAATGWAATAPLKTTNVFNTTSATDYWCVDSNGASKVVDSAIAATAVICP
jgi:prepilin-type N-terminal cleavage/methylation domain-containing protein